MRSLDHPLMYYERLFRTDPSPPENASELAEVFSVIRRLYRDGLPLYSRANLEEISQALHDEPSHRRSTIAVRAMDGSVVDFPIRTGMTEPHHVPGQEKIITQPFLYYRSIEQLTESNYNFELPVAFCSIRLCHNVDLRDAHTKEAVVPVAPCLSLHEMNRSLDRARQEWESWQECQTLRSTLQSSMPLRFSPRKIVGLALGTLCRPESQGLAAQLVRRSAFQHALLLTLRDLLSDPGTPLPCFVQDPVYCASDCDVLAQRGIQVLPDPQGLLEIDDGTVLVSCEPDVPVRQLVADLARPTLIIWGCPPGEAPPLPGLSTDPESPRVRTMLETFYERLDFPANLEEFGRLSMYVRLTPTPST